MKTTVSKYEFYRAFEKSGRDNFSYDGLDILFEYLESVESDTGEEIELDVIALCCDYDESSIESIASQYDIDLTDCDDDKREIVREYLERRTSICGETVNGFIYCTSF